MSDIINNTDKKIKKIQSVTPREAKTASKSSLIVEETTALGIVVAGLMLVEIALVPGVFIGGLAVLGPKYLARHRKSLLGSLSKLQNLNSKKYNMPNEQDQEKLKSYSIFGVQRTLAKTFTFRVLSSSLDFTWNYALLGDVATAAGLSGFGFIASTTFYFIHEMSWNHLKAQPEKKSFNIFLSSTKESSFDTISNQDGRWFLHINPTLAKTITFRTMATLAEFTTNYVVVRDIPMAAALSAFGFICGPFVYYGHEKIWEQYPGKPESNPHPHDFEQSFISYNKNA